MRDHSAFIALLESRATRPFDWGHDRHDCVSFAAACVEALTGDNPIRRAGMTWTTERGALRVIARMGGLAACVDSVLPRLPATAFAHRGDVGLVEFEGRESLVVFEGHLLVGAGVEGLLRLPRELAKIAWSAECVA